jgi:hypothetical protein
MEIWTTQADGLLDGGKDEEGGKGGVVADALLQSGTDHGGRKGGVEATAEEGARAGRSGGVAFHGLVLRRREGVPAVRSVGKRCAAGMMSNGMEFQTGTPGWAENWPRTLLCPAAEACPAGRRRFLKII